MSIALKLLVLDTEAALARATSPRERASLKSALHGYQRTLDAAVSDPEPRAARAPTVDPETGADDEATKTCECGEVADEGDTFCASCGKKLPTDEDDDEPEASFAPFSSQAHLDAAAAHVQRDALVGYASNVSGKPLKVSDLSTFAASMQARTAATRTADLSRVRAQIDARAKR